MCIAFVICIFVCIAIAAYASIAACYSINNGKGNPKLLNVGIWDDVVSFLLFACHTF